MLTEQGEKAVVFDDDKEIYLEFDCIAIKLDKLLGTIIEFKKNGVALSYHDTKCFLLEGDTLNMSGFKGKLEIKVVK